MQNSSSTRAARGAALFAMLAVMLLLSLVALLMVYRAGVHSAQTRVFADGTMLDDAVRSGVAQAEAVVHAALADPTALTAHEQTAWHVVSSNAEQCVRYRVRVADAARVPTHALAWPARDAVRATLVVAQPGGWRAVLDPRGASLADLTAACRDELRDHGLPEQYAAPLAMSIADAFDENMSASGGATPRAQGFEGLALEAIWRGIEQVVPAATVLRQSAFYDIDYHANWRNIMRAFTLAEVAPCVDEHGATNTRVRLSAAPLALPDTRVWLAHWRAFDALWRTRSAQRFVPHVWRGVLAVLCLPCGGAAGTLDVLDNDGEYLYFRGYPLAACAQDNFISLDLCDPRSAPGVLRARRHAFTDVWLVTGMLAQAHCAARVEYEDTPTEAAALWHEKSAPGSGSNDWLYATPNDTVLALQVPLTRARGAVGVHARQADVAVLGNRGVRALQVAGWRWLRPASAVTNDIIDLTEVIRVPRQPSRAAASALVQPGTLWWWTDDAALLPPAARGVASRVPRERAGVAVAVQSCTLEPSPLGGWAWRVTLRDDVVGRMRADGPHDDVVRIAPRAATAGDQAFGVIERRGNALLLHVGPRARAEQWLPHAGDTLRIGGICAAMAGTESVVQTALDESVLHVGDDTRTVAPGTWLRPHAGHWVRTAGAPQPLRMGALTTAIDSVSARLALTPIRAALAAVTTPAQAPFWRALDERIRPIGACLPVAAARMTGNAAGWHPARMAVFRAGRTSWLTRAGQTTWPADFWRGYELQLPVSSQRLRIVASAGRGFSVDAPARTAAADARITPGFADDAYVSSDSADGVWTWQVPAAACLPARLHLLSYAATATSTPVRFSVALWNDVRGVWDEQCRAQPVAADDTVAVGRLTPQHISRGGLLRVRVQADAARAWLRGIYLVPGEAAGQAVVTQGLRSDGFVAEIDAEVVQGSTVLAQRRTRALLVRTWDARGDALWPVVRCARFEPRR